jgi:hypothetical protein
MTSTKSKVNNNTQVYVIIHWHIDCKEISVAYNKKYVKSHKPPIWMKNFVVDNIIAFSKVNILAAKIRKFVYFR